MTRSITVCLVAVLACGHVDSSDRQSPRDGAAQLGVRNGHAMTYDTDRGRVILYGGADAAPAPGHRPPNLIVQQAVHHHVLRNPYVATFMQDLPAMPLTYDFYDRAEASAVRAIAGEAPIGGKLPIALPGMFEEGHGLMRGKGVGVVGSPVISWGGTASREAAGSAAGRDD